MIIDLRRETLAARLGAAAGRARRPRLWGTFTLSLLGCCQRQALSLERAYAAVLPLRERGIEGYVAHRGLSSLGPRPFRMASGNNLAPHFSGAFFCQLFPAAAAAATYSGFPLFKASAAIPSVGAVVATGTP